MLANDAPVAVAPGRLTKAPPRIVILGGGSVGLIVAQRLRRKFTRYEAAILVVDPRPYAQYPPFLPEAASGSIESRDVVAPLRRALPTCDVLQAQCTRIDSANRLLTITPEDGPEYHITYDQLVISFGSVSRTLPIPGLAETAIGFKNVEEGIAIRNRVLNRMDVAAGTLDPVLRQRMLTFTFIGGGFAGIEAIGEMEDMARYACRRYPTLSPADLRFVLIEGSDRILPEVSPAMGLRTLRSLEARGTTFYLNTFLNSCVGGHVVTSTGVEFDSDTIVWCAGIKANPVLVEASDLPLDRINRVLVLPTLQVANEAGDIVPGVWAAGDCAAVPDLVLGDGKFCPPNAQYAVREAKQLAKNITATLRGGKIEPFRHKNIGVVCSTGWWKGCAEFLGGKIKLWGPMAWLAHRAYHVYAMPTWNRKIRIFFGWFWQLITGREIISLGSVEDPRREFLKSAVPAAPLGTVIPQHAESAAATGVSGVEV